MLLTAGCLAPRYTPTTQYTLDTRVEIERREQTETTIALRDIDALLPLKRAVVYLDEGLTLGQFANTEWAELPRDMVGRALLDALLASGAFLDVGYAMDTPPPTFMLTGQLRKFYANRTTDPWTAEIELYLQLRESGNRAKIWAGALSATEPLQTNDPASLPNAMSRALAQIVQEATGTIAAHASK